MKQILLAACSRAALAGLFLMGASAACAADATAGAADTTTTATSDNSAATVGGVVVTARRTSENQEKVPEAITAFSQQMLTQHAITSPFDLETHVPGLIVEAQSGDPGQPTFAIRGRGLNYGAASGSVETYFADVPLSSPFDIPALPPQFFDLQSLQVLKGPQGTLFGRSTTAGAVLIVPQAPTNELGGYVRVQGGSYGDFQFEGAVNLPLVADKVLLRVAAFDWQREGYSHEITSFNGVPILNSVTGAPMTAQSWNNQNEREVRVSLLVRPTENLTNTTIFTYHWDHTAHSSGAGLLFNNGAAPLASNPGLAAVYAGHPIGTAFPAPGYNTRDSALDIDIGTPTNKIWAIINTTNWDITSDITLKNIFGFIDSTGYVDMGTDADGGPSPVISLLNPPRPSRNWQYTDELQLHGSSFGGRLTWLVGGLVDTTREPGNPTDINYANPITIGNPPYGEWSAVFVQNTFNSFAAYVAGTFKVTDTLNLQGGFRHSWNEIFERSASASLGTPGGPPGSFPVGQPVGYALGTQQDFKANSPGDTYMAEMDWTPIHGAMLYGGYRRGFKHGGFNESALNSGLESFGPESVDDLYGGLKWQFNIGGMPGRFNIEGYYDFYHNQQTFYLSLVGIQLTTVTVNVPESIYRGIDADFALDPTDWLTVEASYAFIDGHNSKWPDESCVVATCVQPFPPFSVVPPNGANLAVNPIPFVARNHVAATFRFHTELPDGKGEIAFAPTVSYQSHEVTFALANLLPQAEAVVFGGNFNNLALGGAVMPGYYLLNLRAEWNRIFGSRISAALNVENATNNLYRLSTASTLNFGAQGDAYGPPLMVSAELSTKF
jgi:iron complex outermembrane receptor protein